jgi:hypothetical protein
MSNFYLNDSGSQTWQVVADDSGDLDQVAVSSETASASTINDLATNTTSWTLGVATTGRLTATPATYSGANPLSINLTSPSGFVFAIVVDADGEVDTQGVAPTAQNLVITWFRRTRIGGAWLDGTGTVPLNEDSELYEVDILNSSGAVVRTLSGLTSPSAIYTAAQMSADFAIPPASVKVNVYQISGEVGRGFAGSAIVPAPTSAPYAGAAPGALGGQLFYVNGT